MKKSLIVCCVSIFAVALSATADAGLLGYWRFENNLNDSSGNNRPMSPDPRVFGGGLIGSALDINGVVPQTVEQGGTTAGPGIDDNVFDFGGSDFTISLWAFFNSLPGEQQLIEKFQHPGGPGWTLYVKNTGGPNDQVEFFGQGVGAVTGNLVGVQASQWNHIVLRRSGNDFDIKVGNVAASPVANLPGAITDSPVALGIGFRRNGPPGQNALNGLIDEVAIWDEALSDATITDLYNNGNGVIIPEPASLVMLGLGSLALLVRRRRA